MQYFYSKRKHGTKVGKINFEDLIDGQYSNLTDFLKANNVIFDSLSVCTINLPDYTKAQHSLVGRAPDASKINKEPKSIMGTILKKIYEVNPVIALVISTLSELIPNMIARSVVQIKNKLLNLK